MAAAENLEIIVEVDISEAVANLTELQDELEELADKIRDVDARGTEGISISSHVESIEGDLQRVRRQIQGFEMANELDIATDVGRVSGPGPLSMMAGGGGGAGGAGGAILFDRGADIQESGFLGALHTARDGLREFAEESELTNINMSDMHNIMARIVPMLLVFVGAIPAAITAIYTLAAAAATAAASMLAMVGFGAMGFAMQGGEFNTERLTQAFEQVQADFIDAFAPLANRLQPIFEDALAGLESLFDAIAGEGDALMALTDEARAFGNFILEFVPNALRTLAALVESMSGIFGNMGRWLNQNFTSVVRTLVALTAEIVPHLAQFAKVVGDILPSLIRFSMGFLSVATATIKFVSALGSLFGWLGISERALGVVIGSLLSLITIVALGSSIIGSVFVTSLLGAVKSLYMVYLAALRVNTSLLTMAVGGIATAIYSVYSFIKSLIVGKGSLYAFATSVWSTNAALAAFLTLVTIGAGLAIVGMALSAASGFMSMADGIDSATSSLKDFKRVQSGMGGDGFGGSGDNPYGFDPENPDDTPGGSNNITVLNVESSGNPDEDRSNMERADWLSGRTTGG